MLPNFEANISNGFIVKTSKKMRWIIFLEMVDKTKGLEISTILGPAAYRNSKHVTNWDFSIFVTISRAPAFSKSILVLFSSFQPHGVEARPSPGRVSARPWALPPGWPPLAMRMHEP